jgi:hypothetical protein
VLVKVEEAEVALRGQKAFNVGFEESVAVAIVVPSIDWMMMTIEPLEIPIQCMLTILISLSSTPENQPNSENILGKDFRK